MLFSTTSPWLRKTAGNGIIDPRRKKTLARLLKARRRAGTDVIIFKIFLRKNCVFRLKTMLNFEKS
jgi:hypothetical protein